MDRGRRPREVLRRDPGQLGHHLIGQRGIAARLPLVLERHGPLRSRERLLERARSDDVAVVLLELDRDDRAGFWWRTPWPERLELARGTGHPTGQGELEGALDGRLASLVRAADDGQARGKLDVEGAIATEVAALQTADPHRETL